MKDSISLQNSVNNHGYSFPSDFELSLHEKDSHSDNPALYVGTYGKYNYGSIFGQWVDLTSFDDYEEFIDYCKSLHCDEEDPELMFQDFENIPEALYCECCIDEEAFERIIEYANNPNREALDAYLQVFSPNEIDRFSDRYYGHYDSEEDFAYEIANECYDIDNSDSFLARYFDYKSYARDLFMSDYEYQNGYVFANI